MRDHRCHMYRFTLIVFLKFITISDIAASANTVRYDGAQLWRIYNISETFGDKGKLLLSEKIEKEFDANIWHQNREYMDISIERKHLETAMLFFEQHNLKKEILNSNIQDLFDDEEKMHTYTDSSKKKRSISEGMNWRQFHNLETIYAYLFAVSQNYPDLCTMFNIGQTANGRKLLVLRISENLNNKAIWLDGGIHAREWITPASVTFIISQLVTYWHQHDVYVRNKTWLIMPVINPDGYVYSYDVDRLWRKNRRPNANSACFGVDLNRNFAIGWGGKGSSSKPCSESYRGIAPESELETRAVRDFLMQNKSNLSAFVTYHSYGQFILYPWAYKETTVENSGKLQRLGELAAINIQKKTGKFYQTLITYEFVGVIGGISSDWARAILDIEYVFAVELGDQGQYGFILPVDEIYTTARAAFDFVLTVAKTM